MRFIKTMKINTFKNLLNLNKLSSKKCKHWFELTKTCTKIEYDVIKELEQKSTTRADNTPRLDKMKCEKSVHTKRQQ